MDVPPSPGFHDIFNFTRYILDLGESIIIIFTEISRDISLPLLELTLVGVAMTVEVHGPRVYQAKSEGPQMNGTCNTDAHDLSS